MTSYVRIAVNKNKDNIFYVICPTKYGSPEFENLRNTFVDIFIDLIENCNNIHNKIIIATKNYSQHLDFFKSTTIENIVTKVQYTLIQVACKHDSLKVLKHLKNGFFKDTELTKLFIPIIKEKNKKLILDFIDHLMKTLLPPKLIYAAAVECLKLGQDYALKKLLPHIEDINYLYQHENDLSLLMLSILRTQDNSNKIIKLLLDHPKIDVSHRNNFGANALESLIFKNNTEMVKYFCATKQPDLINRDNPYFQKLLIACKNDNLEIFKALYSFEPSFKGYTNIIKQTPIMLAIDLGLSNIVIFLIGCNSSIINELDMCGDSALNYAIRNNLYNLVEIILACSPKPSINNGGISSLMIAATSSNVNILKLLLNTKNFNDIFQKAKDPDSSNLLMLVSATDKFDNLIVIVDHLKKSLGSKANIISYFNEINNKNVNALMIALYYNQEACYKILYDCNIDLEVTIDGRFIDSAYHWAARNNKSINAINFLVTKSKHKVENLNKKNQYGLNVLGTAIQCKNVLVTDYLLYKITKTDYDYCTSNKVPNLLNLAAESKEMSIFALPIYIRNLSYRTKIPPFQLSTLLNNILKNCKLEHKLNFEIQLELDSNYFVQFADLETNKFTIKSENLIKNLRNLVSEDISITSESFLDCLYRSADEYHEPETKDCCNIEENDYDLDIQTIDLQTKISNYTNKKITELSLITNEFEKIRNSLEKKLELSFQPKYLKELNEFSERLNDTEQTFDLAFNYYREKTKTELAMISLDYKRYWLNNLSLYLDALEKADEIISELNSDLKCILPNENKVAKKDSDGNVIERSKSHDEVLKSIESRRTSKANKELEDSRRSSISIDERSKSQPFPSSLIKRHSVESRIIGNTSINVNSKSKHYKYNPLYSQYKIEYDYNLYLKEIALKQHNFYNFFKFNLQQDLIFENQDNKFRVCCYLGILGKAFQLLKYKVFPTLDILFVFELRNSIYHPKYKLVANNDNIKILQLLVKILFKFLAKLKHQKTKIKTNKNSFMAYIRLELSNNYVNISSGILANWETFLTQNSESIIDSSNFVLINHRDELNSLRALHKESLEEGSISEDQLSSDVLDFGKEYILARMGSLLRPGQNDRLKKAGEKIRHIRI